MEKKWFKGKLVLNFETLAEDADEAETNMMLALDDMLNLPDNECLQFDKWKDAEIDIEGAEGWAMVKIRTPFAIAAAVITAAVVFANPEKMTALSWFAGVSTGILVTYVASRVEE